jgi:CO/xanthine dehydrogenase FAD-binding subunit
LARPSILVDINGVEELSGIDQIDGAVRIMTCTRQAAAIGSMEISENVPLLAEAMRFIGHHQTRNRGTVGGSVAHGDPAAEIPLIAVALDASINLRSKDHGRSVAAQDFFEGPMMTGRDEGEILTDVAFPVWQGNVGTGFQEVSQRHGDFAIVAVAVQLSLDDSGICQRIAIAIGGAGGTPIRLEQAESALTGNPVTEESIGDALASMGDALDPADDTHGSAAYRRRVARVLAERAILEAAA